MSKQEKASWTLLVLNVIVGIWYFSAVATSGPGLIMSPQLGSLIARIIVVAIVLAIAGQIVTNWFMAKSKDAVEVDERDQLIGLKAFRNGYWILGIAVAALIVGLWVLTRLTHPPTGELAINSNGSSLKLTDAPVIANLLLCVLVATEIVVQSSKVFYYRRGY